MPEDEKKVIELIHTEKNISIKLAKSWQGGSKSW